MNKIFHYFSLQYSAIQKTVLRYDRLWSIAGISQILSKLNEIEFPGIVERHSGEVLVAGGGKFTARFDTADGAEKARKEIVKAISTALPMLEFQESRIDNADTLKKARDKGLVTTLRDKKKQFRGYGVTYNPHLKPCDECGEYPVVKTLKIEDEEIQLCRVCHQARAARPQIRDILSKQEDGEAFTSLEKIYASYWSELRNKDQDLPTPLIPHDFEKIFPKKKDKDKSKGEEGDSGERRRMAVWFSDANNMNSKVPIWFSQEDATIPEIFRQVKEVNIAILFKTLLSVFPPSTWNKHDEEFYLPFRLIVAGGDDLCLVMPEEYILDFTITFSAQISEALKGLGGERDHPLNTEWLQKKFEEWKKSQGKDAEERTPPGPYCFGASFVITPIHTPFKAIHYLGEPLMSAAKEVTKREADSINWQLLNVDEQEEDIIEFEKPIFIQKKKDSESRSAIPDSLSFEEYLELMKDNEYGELSRSQMKNIASILLDAKGDSAKAELALIKFALAGREKGLTKLLSDSRLRKNGNLDLPKVATLLEMLNIKRRKHEHSHTDKGHD